jgi:hypothetical protein
MEIPMSILRTAAVFALLSVAACASSSESQESTTSSAVSSAVASISAAHSSCGAVRGFVDSHGAALVYSSANIYERVVTSGAYCEVGESTNPYFVVTNDSSECFAGYVCTNFGGAGESGGGAGE